MGATVKAGERVTLDLDPARHAYLVPATGAVEVGGVRIEARDGAAITDVASVEIVGIEDAEVVMPIFDSWVFRAHAKLLNSLVVASVLAKLVVPRLDAVRH